MIDRKYLPTIAELVDRLSIVLMKSIFIPERREEYRQEMELLRHDINDEKFFSALVLMLVNREIWLNEELIRTEEGQVTRSTARGIDGQLRLTHALNGVRNQAKNELAKLFGERVDVKVKCLAAELPPDMKQWDVFS